MSQRILVPIFIAMMLMVFQNCSDSVPNGQGRANAPSTNGSPNPSPLPTPTPGSDPAGALTASSSPAAPTSVDMVTITPQGGSPGYTYAKISGGGTLAGNVYSPGAGGGAAQIEVTDTAGRKALVNLSTSVPATVTIYRFIHQGGQVSYHDRADAGGGALGASLTPAGTRKLFQTAIAGSIAVVKCYRTSREALVDGTTYFTTGACPATYTNMGTFAYAVTALRPNTAAAGELAIAGYLPNY